MGRGSGSAESRIDGGATEYSQTTTAKRREGGRTGEMKEQRVDREREGAPRRS